MANTTWTPYLDSMSINNDNISIETKQQQQEKSLWYQPLLQKIDYIYMQILLITTLYIMEPWERLLVISIFFLIISLFTYSAFAFIPFHVHNILRSTMSSLNDTFIH